MAGDCVGSSISAFGEWASEHARIGEDEVGAKLSALAGDGDGWIGRLVRYDWLAGMGCWRFDSGEGLGRYLT